MKVPSPLGLQVIPQQLRPINELSPLKMRQLCFAGTGGRPSLRIKCLGGASVDFFELAALEPGDLPVSSLPVSLSVLGNPLALISPDPHQESPDGDLTTPSSGILPSELPASPE